MNRTLIHVGRSSSAPTTHFTGDDMYILLMTYMTPLSSNQTKWLMFPDLDSATKKLEELKRASLGYLGSGYGLFSPILTQAIIFEAGRPAITYSLQESSAENTPSTSPH